jgi:hypothetical protein
MYIHVYMNTPAVASTVSPNSSCASLGAVSRLESISYIIYDDDVLFIGTRFSNLYGWHIHCGVEVTESNKQHTLSCRAD